MKSMFLTLKNLRRALPLTLALCLGNVVWGKPSTQSIQLSPDPLISGQPFTIAVAASPDVTQATATVDFHPGKSPSLDISLTKSGSNWTGSGIVPADLRLRPSKDEGQVKVVLLDAVGHRDEGVIHVDVNPAPIHVISAVFAGGILTVQGDDRDNTLTVSRDVAGTILVTVDATALAVTGGVPTVTNTSLIQIYGQAGNDVLLVDDGNGRMPPANLFGGNGNDTLTGSASDDVLDGGPGDDTLFGRDGSDQLVGGPGNDVLVGGRGADQIRGGDGDDQIVWNPGDGSDVIEGEDGIDTLVFNGANVGEKVDLSANGQRLRFFRDIANITMDCAGVERVMFQALGGGDQVTVNDLTGTQVNQVLLDLASPPRSGTGDGQADTIVLNGTANNDVITVTELVGGMEVHGLPVAVTIIGAERDLDKLVINSVGGADAVNFIGSTTNEVVDFSADDQQLRFFSEVAAMVVDCTGVEQVNFHPLGGVDRITVNDLTGTGVVGVGIDLSRAPGATNVQTDTIVVNGTQTNDTVTLSGSAAGVNIVGLTAAVTVVGAEQALDKLIINGLGGADLLDASAVQAGAIGLTLNGGDGDDVLIGGQGNDVLIGGRGADALSGGAGDDVFVWNPGDGSDVIEGQAGNDTLVFNGANIAEKVDLSANGQRLRFFRDVASITMDCDGIEFVQFNALGGADTITVGDLTGTDVTGVSLDLAFPPGSGAGDNSADTVIVNGTTGNDVVTVSGTPAGVSILGLSASVSVVGSEPALDQLVINALAGDDAVVASDLQAGVINLTIDGGPGDDVLVGSAGVDVLMGGEGDDVLNGGPGFDVLDGGPGDNVIIQ